jgi:hypothetical protein
MWFLQENNGKPDICESICNGLTPIIFVFKLRFSQPCIRLHGVTSYKVFYSVMAVLSHYMVISTDNRLCYAIGPQMLLVDDVKRETCRNFFQPNFKHMYSDILYVLP